MLQESWNGREMGLNPGSDHQTIVEGAFQMLCDWTTLALGYGLISKLLTNEYAGTILCF